MKTKNINTLRNLHGLTLVELLVVITILAILGTIAFMSLGGYSANARDSARVSDIGSVSKTLEAYVLQTGNYPVPTSPFPLTYSGSPVFLQGTLGDSVITNLSSSNAKITKKPIDPLTGKEYAYSALAFGRGYQIKADYEGESIAFSFDSGSYSCIASYSSFSPFLSSNISFITPVNAASGSPTLSYVKGSYNGLVAKTETGGITYVLTIPSLITNATGTGDVSTLSGKFLFHRESNTVGLSFTPSVVFSGTTLPKDDSTGQITALVNAIKLSYTGTQIVEKNANTNASDINSILSATDSNKIALIGSAIIKNYLGGKTSIGDGGSGGGSSFTCTGTAPVQVTGMTISTTAPTNSTTSWTYSGSTNVAGPACTWKCDAGYFQSGNSCVGQIYVDDVFSTYLYSGNGSTQTIANGIDLAGQGGMVWFKNRAAGHQTLVDFEWGNTSLRLLNLSSSQTIANFLTYNANGFTINSADNVANATSNNYVSWTFREAPKFFAETTATVNSDTTISFPELGTIGLVVVQGTFGNDSPFYVWHRSGTAGKLTNLNSTSGETVSNAITVSGTDITLHSAAYDGGGVVVYAWAHDVSANGIIQAGSHTGNGAAGGQQINLGWEPQWLITKNTTGDAWMMYDTMRGWNTTDSDSYFAANSQAAESTSPFGEPTVNGFLAKGNNNNASGTNYLYLAIRRPNKSVTDPTKAFGLATYTGDSSTNRSINLGVRSDLVISKLLNNYGGSYASCWTDTIRGGGSLAISSAQGDADSYWTIAGWYNFNSTGYNIGGTAYAYSNNAPTNFISYGFRRVPGFFDIISYTGDGVGGSKQHGLGAVPEMIIFKMRSGAIADWGVYHSYLGASAYTLLNSANPAVTSTFQLTNSTTPTSTQFSVWNNSMNNGSGQNYVAYLFASVPGVSKVGGYTSDGSSKIINAALTSSARFILIKRTDVSGDWFLFDTAHGINAGGNDPYTLLNSPNIEVTNTNYIEPNSTGFALNANTPINTNGGTYIYYAVQ